MSASPRRAAARRADAAAMLWFAVLAALLTWPVVVQPGAMLLGHPRCSAGCHAWVLWATAHELLPSGRLVTDLLFHPHGGDVVRLYGSDLLGPVVLAPLQRVFGLAPWTVYNLWVLLGLVANGVAAYALCRDRGLHRGAALVGGTVFAAAPFLHHELLNGTSELAIAPALPLFAMLWLRLLDQRGEDPAASLSWRAPWRSRAVRTGALAGLVAGLGGLASAYTPFFLALFAAVTLALRFASRADPLVTRSIAAGWLACVLVAGALLAPAVALHATHGAGALHARRTAWGIEAQPLPDSHAPLLGFVDPRTPSLPVVQVDDDGGVYLYWTLGSVTLGLVALALAGIALARRRVGEPLRWLAVAIAGVLVALGPYLVLARDAVRLGGEPLPMPSWLLQAMVPGFGITALHSYRYTALVVLALAVLAAAGVAALPRRRGLAPALCALVVVESLWLTPPGWPLPRTPVPDEPFWGQLADASDGAVLLLPYRGNDLGDLSWGLLAQTRHGRPWVDGGMHFRTTDASLALLRGNPLLTALSSGPAAELPDAATAAAGFAALAASGYDAVVLDRARFRRDDLPDDVILQLPRGSAWDHAATEAWLVEQLGPPRLDDGRLAAFCIPGPEEVR